MANNYCHLYSELHCARRVYSIKVSVKTIKNCQNYQRRHALNRDEGGGGGVGGVGGRAKQQKH